jgi:CheY-like chemotaxis protein
MDDLQKLVILVVDDIQINLDIAESILKDQFGLRLCTSARAAMEVLNREKISLILLDIEMPDISGFEFLQQIRQNPEAKDIPVIIVTSYATPEFIERAIASGADGYLIKPFIPETLLKRVNTILKIDG